MILAIDWSSRIASRFFDGKRLMSFAAIRRAKILQAVASWLLNVGRCGSAYFSGSGRWEAAKIRL